MIKFLPNASFALGTSSLGHLTRPKAFSILNFAVENGLTDFDTAPLYGNSEGFLGDFSKRSGVKLNVTTKIGMPRPIVFSRNYVRETIYRSVELLSPNPIHTLFIHSIPLKSLSVDGLAELFRLREQGLFSQLGFSGDNDELRLASTSGHFDTFMISLNLIDLSNYSLFKNLSQSHFISIKRPIANAVWRQQSKWKIQRHLWRLLGMGRGFEMESYPFRYEQWVKNFSQESPPQLEDFLKFLISIPINKRIVLGVSTLKHLKQITDFIAELSIENVNPNYPEDIYQKWLRLNKYNWKALR